MSKVTLLWYSLDKTEYWLGKGKINNSLIHLSPKSILLTAGRWHCIGDMTQFQKIRLSEKKESPNLIVTHQNFALISTSQKNKQLLSFKSCCLSDLSSNCGCTQLPGVRGSSKSCHIRRKEKIPLDNGLQSPPQ